MVATPIVNMATNIPHQLTKGDRLNSAFLNNQQVVVTITGFHGNKERNKQQLSAHSQKMYRDLTGDIFVQQDG
jgi:hypothetical protein